MESAHVHKRLGRSMVGMSCDVYLCVPVLYIVGVVKWSNVKKYVFFHDFAKLGNSK